MLKEPAVEYFRSKSAIYNERYSVKAEGDLVWVRHNAILSLVNEWDFPSGSKFLDLGCGPGILTRDLARMGFTGIGLDASESMVQSSREMAAIEGTAKAWIYMMGDVESLPFADQTFDAVFSSGVIDYLPTDGKILSEAARVLKPGGKLIVCFTNKFGYTIALSTPMYWLKRIPGMRRFASLARSIFVGGKHGAMEFNFLPRKHRPSQARDSVKRQGFHIRTDRYVHFSVLPAPFCTIMSRLGLRIDERLNGLDGTILRVLGSCYILDTSIEK